VIGFAAVRCLPGVVGQAIFGVESQESAAKPHAFALSFRAVKAGKCHLNLVALF
jgi:hypothetical protein